MRELHGVLCIVRHSRHSQDIYKSFSLITMNPIATEDPTSFHPLPTYRHLKWPSIRPLVYHVPGNLRTRFRQHKLLVRAVQSLLRRRRRRRRSSSLKGARRASSNFPVFSAVLRIPSRLNHILESRIAHYGSALDHATYGRHFITAMFLSRQL